MCVWGEAHACEHVSSACDVTEKLQIPHTKSLRKVGHLASIHILRRVSRTGTSLSHWVVSTKLVRVQMLLRSCLNPRTKTLKIYFRRGLVAQSLKHCDSK